MSAPVTMLFSRLSNNFWEDCVPPEDAMERIPRLRTRYFRPYFNCDLAVFHRVMRRAAAAGLTGVVLDVGDAVRTRSRPDVGLPDALSPERLREELAFCRDLGLEVFPKLNFSSTHDVWLGRYARMVSTPEYYACCRDLIDEVAELFSGPRWFHLGMDEEDCNSQAYYDYAVVRRGALWWHDLNLLVAAVDAAGSRPWVWSDKIWHASDEEFATNMPRHVLQSNWYYRSDFNLDPAVNPNAVQVESFLRLDALGYDQVPTGSSYRVLDNYPQLVAFCEGRLQRPPLGYLCSPWRGTLPCYEQEYMTCIDNAREGNQLLRREGTA